MERATRLEKVEALEDRGHMTEAHATGQFQEQVSSSCDAMSGSIFKQEQERTVPVR